MTTWKDRLRDADEALARDLSPAESQRLRRTVLAAASTAGRARRWPLPFVLTAASLAAASVALVLTIVTASPGPQVPSGTRADGGQAQTTEGPQAETGPRQLHFSTPGGTRIIWVFDADFEVKGTLP
jgi:hypothetical protein